MCFAEEGEKEGGGEEKEGVVNREEERGEESEGKG